VTFIKAQRIRWLGHVKRIEAEAMPRRTMEGRLFIGRRTGRPRLRWMDDVADLRAMKIRQWTEKTVCQEGQGSPRAVASGGWMDFCHCKRWESLNA
jgi:hypothetical protein